MRHTVVLIRHAKAEQYGSTDHARTLAPRGESDAAAVGEWCRASGLVPDQMLVSTATRTRQTAEGILATAGWSLEPWFDSTLYGADESAMLELLRAQEDDVDTVVVVGHNPTIADVAYLLDDLQGEELGEFPTSALAVIDFEGPWSTLEPGVGTVRSYAVPRD